jgi:hypothetical protein
MQKSQQTLCILALKFLDNLEPFYAAAGENSTRLIIHNNNNNKQTKSTAKRPPAVGAVGH